MAVRDLNGKDLRTALDVVYRLNDSPAEVEMPGEVLAGFRKLVGSDSLSYTHIDHAGRRFVSFTIDPPNVDPDELAAFRAAFHQHPGLAAYRSGKLGVGTSAALTDLAPLTALRRLPLYIDSYRQRGVSDQFLSVVHVGKRHGSVLAFDRSSRGFSNRDRSVVDLVTAHLSQSVRLRRRVVSLTTAVRRVAGHADEVQRAASRLTELTAREREVVEHVLAGLPDRAIARSLRISPRTVHKHLENIYRKTDLNSRTGLIAAVHRGSGGAGSHSRPQEPGINGSAE